MDLGISSREEEVCTSSPKEEGTLTMGSLLLSSIESCGGYHGISSRGGGLPFLFLRRREGRMIMVIFFLSFVESCGGDHGRSSTEEDVCRSDS